MIKFRGLINKFINNNRLKLTMLRFSKLSRANCDVSRGYR